jgi:hypothetical protein
MFLVFAEHQHLRPLNPVGPIFVGIDEFRAEPHLRKGIGGWIAGYDCPRPSRLPRPWRIYDRHGRNKHAGRRLGQTQRPRPAEYFPYAAAPEIDPSGVSTRGLNFRRLMM